MSILQNINPRRLTGADIENGSSQFLRADGTFATTPLAAHNHELSEITGLILNGKIDSALLPALAISETSVVASQAAMLALVAQRGDVAVRTDLSKSFILKGTDPSVLGDWAELLTPADLIQSVNGKVGAVTITAAELGASLDTHNHDDTYLKLAGGTLTGALITDSTVNFKLSGKKTWSIGRVSGTDSLSFSPSTTNDGTTWDTSKQVLFGADGTMTVGGNAVWHAGTLQKSEFATAGHTHTEYSSTSHTHSQLHNRNEDTGTTNNLFGINTASALVLDAGYGIYYGNNGSVTNSPYFRMVKPATGLTRFEFYENWAGTGTVFAELKASTYKNTAGTEVSYVGHTHTEYSAIGHNHDSTYLKLAGGTVTGDTSFVYLNPTLKFAHSAYGNTGTITFDFKHSSTDGELRNTFKSVAHPAAGNSYFVFTNGTVESLRIDSLNNKGVTTTLPMGAGSFKGANKNSGIHFYNFNSAEHAVRIASSQLGSFGRGDFRIYVRPSGYDAQDADVMFFVPGTNRNVSINNGVTDLGAAFGIKGNGKTSDTTSFLVKDSDGVDLFKITDDGTISIKGGSSLSTTAHNHDGSYLKLTGGTITGALTANAAMTATANGQVLTAVDVNPTFTTGSFTGVIQRLLNLSTSGTNRGSVNYNSTADTLEFKSEGRLDLTAGSGSSSVYLNAGKAYLNASAILYRMAEATSYATQQGSRPILLQSSLWNGTVSTPTYSGIKSIADTVLQSDRLSIFTGSDSAGLNGTERLSIFSDSGNVQIGSSVQNGARLFVKSAGSSASTTAFEIHNSSGTSLFKVTDDGFMTVLGKSVAVNDPNASTTNAPGTETAISWTKIATVNMASNNMSDANVQLAITGSNSSYQSIIVGLNFLQTNAGQAPVMGANVSASSSISTPHLDDSCILITSNGHGTNFDVYLKKNITYGQFKVYEISNNVKNGAATITYLSNQGWLNTAPTGTYSIQSTGLTYSGNAVWHDGLTNLNASKLGSGTLADARLSSNIPKKDASNIFTSGQYFTGGTTGTTAFLTKVTGDAVDRVKMSVDGKLEIGDGTNARDTFLHRPAPSTLKTDNNFIVGGKVGINSGNTPAYSLDVAGDLRVSDNTANSNTKAIVITHTGGISHGNSGAGFAFSHTNPVTGRFYHGYTFNTGGSTGNSFTAPSFAIKHTIGSAIGNSLSEVHTDFMTNSTVTGSPFSAIRIVGQTGNVLINSTTNDGYKFDVNGTTRLNGAVTVGALQVFSAGGSLSDTALSSNVPKKDASNTYSSLNTFSNNTYFDAITYNRGVNVIIRGVQTGGWDKGFAIEDFSGTAIGKFGYSTATGAMHMLRGNNAFNVYGTYNEVTTGNDSNVALKISNTAANPTGELTQWFSGATKVASMSQTGVLNAVGGLQENGTNLSSKYVQASSKGVANGVTPLGADAKIDTTYLPDSILGQVVYKGTYNATTNTPTLATPPTSTTKGHYYVTSTAGTVFGLDLNVGDWIISNGAAWEKVDNTDAVTTVFGRLGAIVATAGDYDATQITYGTTNVSLALDGKEASFSKNTAFNKNFGTTAGTVSEGSHTHAEYLEKNSSSDVGLSINNEKFISAASGDLYVGFSSDSSNYWSGDSYGFTNYGLGYYDSEAQATNATTGAMYYTWSGGYATDTQANDGFNAAYQSNLGVSNSASQKAVAYSYHAENFGEVKFENGKYAVTTTSRATDNGLSYWRVNVKQNATTHTLEFSENGLYVNGSNVMGTDRTIADTDKILSEGTTNKWFTDTRAVSALLDGYSKASASTALATSTSVKGAFGILEYRLDNLDVSKATTGTLPNARLHADVPIKTVSNVFTLGQYVYNYSGQLTAVAWASKLSTDSQFRFYSEVGGTLKWGDGSSSWDTNLYRGGVNTLKTDSNIWMTSGQHLLTNDIRNITSADNAKLTLLTSGIEMQTAVAANVALKVINSNVAPTGDLVRFISNTSTVAKIGATGDITANSGIVKLGLWNGDGHQVGSLKIDYNSNNNPSISGVGGGIYVNSDLFFNSNITTHSSKTSDLTLSHGRQNANYGVAIRTYDETNTYKTRFRVGAGSGAFAYFNDINLGVGTTTDAGYKLDVNGTTRLNGNVSANYFTNTLNDNNAVLELTSTGAEVSTNITSNVAFKVTNKVTSASGNLQEWVRGTTTVASIASNGLFTTNSDINLNGTGNLNFLNSGTIRNFSIIGGSAALPHSNLQIGTANPNASLTANIVAVFSQRNLQHGSTVASFFDNANLVPPTAGAGHYISFHAKPVINKQAGDTGNVYGFFHNPTVTNLGSGRNIAIETVTGDTLLNTTSGNTIIGGSVNAGFKLDVQGTIRATGIITSHSDVILRDNRDNGFLSQSSSGVTSARLLTIGNATYNRYWLNTGQLVLGATEPTTHSGFQLDVTGTSRFTGSTTITSASQYVATFQSDLPSTTVTIKSVGTPGLNLGAMIDLQKADGTIATPTITNSGRILSTLQTQGYDGSAYRVASSIVTTSDGAASGYVKGRLSFNLHDGASLVEQLRIDSTGKLLFGSAQDTNLYRVSAGQLRTDSSLVVIGNAFMASVGNLSNSSNSVFVPANTGSEIRTAITSNVALKIINTLTTTTSNLAEFIKGTTVVAKVTADGDGDFNALKVKGVQAFVDTTYINPAILVDVYDIPPDVKASLVLTTNWDENGNYIGAPLVGTYAGQECYSSSYLFKCVSDDFWIRLLRQ